MRISDWSSDVCSADLCASPSTREEVANAEKGHAGFGGPAHLAFKYLVERYFPVEHLVEIKAVHADHALAPTESDETVFREAAVADEQAPRPRRLLLDLAVERVQLGDAEGLAVPLGFEKIDLGAKQKAAVDLFAFPTEGVLSPQADGVEQDLEAPLE